MIDGVQGSSSMTPKSVKGFGSMLKRKLTSMANGDGSDDEEPKEECSELFESKFVKQIIEAFNTVLEVVEQQESELNDWIGDDFTNLV